MTKRTRQPIYDVRLVWLYRHETAIGYELVRLTQPVLSIISGKARNAYFMLANGTKSVIDEEVGLTYSNMSWRIAPRWLLQYVRENLLTVLAIARPTREFKNHATRDLILDDLSFRRTGTYISAHPQYVIDPDLPDEYIVLDFQSYLETLGEYDR